MTDEGSITHWIRELKHGDSTAAKQELCNRYFQQLVDLARKKMRNLCRQAEDEEDMAIGALASFFQRVDRGEFPLLEDRYDAWAVLECITSRKVCRAIERAQAKKRGGGETAVEFDIAALEQIASRDPPPDVAAIVAEEIEYLLGYLDDEPTLRAIVDQRLEGRTNREIADNHGVSIRTIERKLDRIRALWNEITSTE